MVNVFSIPAFFIVLREVLEACLVVGIVLAYLSKIGATQYNKWVWLGAGGGIGLSVVLGLIFGIIVWKGGDQIFQGNTEKIFEGVTFLIAAALLTWMIIWMMVMGKKIQTQMEERVENIVDNENISLLKRKLSVFFMVFVQVLREGIETFIFLVGTTQAADDEDAWKSIPLPGILAIIVGLGIAYLVFKGLLQLDIIKFFYISGLVLMAFAAGLVSHAFHEIQEVDAFGPWEVDNDAGEFRDWYNAVMWSTKACCHDKENEFFAMLRALFGYQDTPTFVEWATYFAYWFLIGIIFIAVNWESVRAARTKTKSIATQFSSWSLLFTFVGWVFTLINVTWIGVLSMTLGFALSIVSVFLLYDALAKLVGPVKKMRKTLLFGTGIGWSLLLAFMFVTHLVQMECEGRDGCDLDMFFYFGLIFNPDFNDTGRQEKSWPAIGSLAGSFVVTVFFFAPLAFTIIMTSFNMDSEGDYLHDDAVLVKSAPEYGSEESVDNTVDQATHVQSEQAV